MEVQPRSDDTFVPAKRLAVDSLAPAATKALNALDAAVRRSTIEPGLLDLVRLRASQINGCAYCVDVHSRDALAAGQTERRLLTFATWRETPLFTNRERAVLELTEAITRLADHPVSDEVFDAAALHFSEAELAQLIWVIAVINTWNRLGAVARPWSLV
ncbi:MAG TPA: carboxymuconolactone decarboxylase family protein [Frankiaceae bacterium]|jgi:AhpD family alkylhydroperoxidase|nr:carboxymuconolactone decarboxylase family protein [Frankiaceae bacterium]